MSSRGYRGRFATTRWSLVLAASHRSSPEAQEALTTLFEAYWYPLYGYLRGRGYSADQAQDLTQSFFTVVLEKHVLRAADPSRGRFRAFLLTALKNFAANQRDRELARKRGGGTPILPLEFERAEGRYQLEPADTDTPEAIFDRRWAAALLDRVVARLAAEAERSGREAQFAVLKGYLIGEEPHGSYAITAAELGLSEGALRVAVHRLRRRFRALVHDEVAQTVASPDDVESEIRHLRSAVRR